MRDAITQEISTPRAAKACSFGILLNRDYKAERMGRPAALEGTLNANVDAISWMDYCVWALEPS